MRRGLAAAFVIVVLFTTTPADAADKRAPTARELVRKLIKAKVCDGPPQAVSATGTTVQCTASFSEPIGDIDVAINAYKTKKSMLRALEKERLKECEEGFGTVGGRHIPRDEVQFSVGNTWYTHPYLEQVGIRMRDALGGELKTYACT
jgi:hypothetical protein